MKDKFKRLIALCAMLCITAALTLNLTTGCTSAQFQSGLTSAESAAWTAASAYETVNAATGGVLTKTILNSALVATHNSGDIAVVDAGASIADSVISAQAAAHTAGVTSPAGLQAVATTVLSDPGTIAKAAAAVPASSSGNRPVPTTKLFTEYITIRPIHGWKNPYDVSLARQ